MSNNLISLVGWRLGSIALVSIALAGCGGGSTDDESATDTMPAQSAAEVPTAAPEVETPSTTAPASESRLHQVFQSLTKGMTKNQVRAFVGVTPTGDFGGNLYWVGSDGGLLVYFSGDIVAVAEWAYRQPTSLPNETRNLQ